MTTTKTTIKVPKPTAWPLVAAFGLTLTFAGFLTSYLVGIIGGILSVIGFIGWFKDRFPNNLEITVEVEAHHIPAPVHSTKSTHEEHPHHRAILPLKIHRTQSGLIGGNRRWHRDAYCFSDWQFHHAWFTLVSFQCYVCVSHALYN